MQEPKPDHKPQPDPKSKPEQEPQNVTELVRNKILEDHRLHKTYTV